MRARSKADDDDCEVAPVDACRWRGDDRDGLGASRLELANGPQRDEEGAYGAEAESQADELSNGMDCDGSRDAQQRRASIGRRGYICLTEEDWGEDREEESSGALS